MNRWEKKRLALAKRHRRVRKKVLGTPERPRLCVFRSQRHIYAQVIDDFAGRTLVSASSLSPEVKSKVNGGNVEGAREVGKLAGKKCVENEIAKVVFDRGGYKYHGRVRTLAEGVREAGVRF